MDAVISGIFETPIGKLAHSSFLGLSAQALDGAVKDAGIEWSALDGLLVSSSIVTQYGRPAVALAEYVGITEQLRYAGGPELGGGSPYAAVIEAMALIESGVCDVVGIVCADIPRTGQDRSSSVDRFAAFRDPDYEAPFGLSNVAAYSQLASYHQEVLGTTPEQMAAVAVAQRDFASTHPGAVYRDPITVEDVLESRPVTTQLRLLECRPVADGGGALIVSRRSATTDRARNVEVRGFGMGFTYDTVAQVSELWKTGSYLSSQRAYTMAGIPWEASIDHVDGAMLYDSYTITVLLQLEALGLVERGQSGPLVESGATGRGGRFPVNTHGGCLSHAGPGICHLVEAVAQLRGEATNQIPGAENLIVNGEGGILSANVTLVLSNRED